MPWHIVTGEYPPAPGGVADYTRSVARGLASAGDEVHVWAPAARSELVGDPGVRLHPLACGFGPRGLLALSREFSRQPRPRRLLLQYVPQAFGLRGMNLPFCVWVASLRQTQVWVMFHEVLVLWQPRRLRRAPLAIATRGMAAVLSCRADRSFVSIPSWERLISSFRPRQPRATWLPVPSSVPTDVSPDSVQSVRARLRLAPETPLVGHFGTYGAGLAPILRQTALNVLRADPRRRLLLLGRGGDAFARVLASEPVVANRVMATGELAASDVSAHLAACDALIQPYGDGISTRRTSAMAGLALGIPIATNPGWLTEPIWRESRGVELAASADRVADAAEILLRDPSYAAGVGERGRLLYRGHFSLEHTVRALREEPEDTA